jgi:adenylate kinase
MKHDTLFVLGLPGSGKGTQARKLADHLGYFYFEMGEILRHVAADHTPLGDTVRYAMEHGDLLQDEDIVEVLKLHMRHLNPGQGIIFDGVPRRVGQGQFMLDYLRNTLQHNNFGTVVINIPPEECEKRIAGRVSQEHRADDTPEAVRIRVQQQLSTLSEVMGLLEKNSTIYQIDGTPPIEEVEKAIHGALGVQ